MEDFGEFVAAALPGLLRFGMVLTGDRDRAEDVVQTALVRTMRHWRRIADEQPHAYVRRAMVNAHLSWWRRARRDAPMPVAVEVAVAGDAMASYDEQDRLVRALAALPPRQRAVIVLRYYEQLTEAEIAKAMHCAPGTVKSQSAKAMRTLRGLLDTPELDGALP